MNRLRLLCTLAGLLAFVSTAAAQAGRGEPLVVLELPAEALAHHLGLRSWVFAYHHVGDDLQVRLLHYERTQAGTLEGRYLTSLTEQSDPSGQQHITFVIGPDGSSVPYSLGINTMMTSGTLDDLDLGSFNTLAVTQPGTFLPSTGEAGTFILMARYPGEDGGVTATGNPDDMDAYLALEVGQEEP